MKTYWGSGGIAPRRNKVRMVNLFVNDEMERMWNETTLYNFKVPSWHFPGGTEGTNNAIWTWGLLYTKQAI
jgi:hypothetical protein